MAQSIIAFDTAIVKAIMDFATRDEIASWKATPSRSARGSLSSGRHIPVKVTVAVWGEGLVDSVYKEALVRKEPLHPKKKLRTKKERRRRRNVGDA